MVLLFLGFIVLLIWVVKLQDRVRDLEERDAAHLGAIRALQARLNEREEAPAAGTRAAAAERPVAPEAAARAARPDTARPAVPPPILPPPTTIRERVAPAPPAPPVPPEIRVERQPFDWEALVGVKLFSWVAGIAMALAAIFFLGYSIQVGWLQPPVRMAIGLAVGIGLLVGCELRVARNYAVTANALDAAGIVTLFSTIFASYALWHLVGPAAAFLLFVLVTVVAVTLSIRRDSVFVALLGLVGGFSTPALLSTGQDNPIGLFGYLLLLNAGLAWVAYRKRWVPLVALSLLFTTLYQWAWVTRFLRAERLPLAGGIFLVFPLLAFLALATLGREAETKDAAEERFRLLTAANASLPLLFAVYLAAVPAYGTHYWTLFGFLFCLDAGLFAIAAWRGPHALHLLGGVSTVIVFLAWLANTYPQPLASGAWPAVLAITALFVVFYLATGLAGSRGRRRLTQPAALAVYAAPLLLLTFPVLAANETAFATPAPGFAVLFLLLALVAAYAVFEEVALLYFIAAFLALAAEAIWSGLYLSAERLPAALIVYTGFALFSLGVSLAARAWRPALRSAASLLTLAGYLFLFPVALQRSLSVPPWPMFLVLAVLGLAIGVAALHTRRAGTHLGALVLTQCLLIVWVIASPARPWPTVAVLAACAGAALGLAWSYLARRQGTEGQAVELFDATAAAAVVLAQLLLIVVSMTSGMPGMAWLSLSHVLLAVALLALATFTRMPTLAVVAVVPAWLATWLWQALHPQADFWASNLELALPLYVVFLAYPLVLGRWAGRRIEPHLAAVLASASFFHVARLSLDAGGYASVIGVLPIAQALLLGVLLLALLKLEPAGTRSLGRLALVAGAVLAFVTVAIPLQLEKEWITVGWALEAAALAWLFTRVPHRGLFWTALALAAVVFARLALNPEVLVYQPRGTLRIVNWYLYTYLVCAGSMFVAARLFGQTDDRTVPGGPRASQLLPGAATVLLFLLLNIEIADYFSTGPAITFNLSAGLAQDLTYTLGWAVFAVTLLAAGIWRRSHFARMSAIVLLTVTVLKGFLHDMARLGGLYRVFSFVGLAVCLSLVAIVLQRFVLQRKGEATQ